MRVAVDEVRAQQGLELPDGAVRAGWVMNICSAARLNER
jgi:hypothetical protein